MLSYSDRILEHLNTAINGGDISPFSGFDIDLPSFYAALTNQPTFDGSREVLARLAGGAVQGDFRYVASMSRYLRGGQTKQVFMLALNTIGHLNGDQSRAFGIQAALRTKPGQINGSARVHEFTNAALQFHDARAETGNPWHTARSAEVRLAAGDAAALEVLRSLADGGYANAASVLAFHDAAPVAKETTN